MESLPAILDQSAAHNGNWRDGECKDWTATGDWKNSRESKGAKVVVLECGGVEKAQEGRVYKDWVWHGEFLRWRIRQHKSSGRGVRLD